MPNRWLCWRQLGGLLAVSGMVFGAWSGPAAAPWSPAPDEPPPASRQLPTGGASSAAMPRPGVDDLAGCRLSADGSYTAYGAQVTSQKPKPSIRTSTRLAPGPTTSTDRSWTGPAACLTLSTGNLIER